MTMNQQILEALTNIDKTLRITNMLILAHVLHTVGDEDGEGIIESLEALTNALEYTTNTVNVPPRPNIGPM